MAGIFSTAYTPDVDSLKSILAADIEKYKPSILFTLDRIHPN